MAPEQLRGEAVDAEGVARGDEHGVGLRDERDVRHDVRLV